MQDDFAQQVRALLDHLYDYEYLQESLLAYALDSDGRLLAKERMRLLREALLQSIEGLNPGSDVSPYSPRVRSYNVLTLHYVDRLTIQQVAAELALSERQVYRDLRQAEQDLAVALWTQLRRQVGGSDAPNLVTSKGELALRELGRVGGDDEAIDFASVLQGAIGAVQRLAEQLQVKIDLGVVEDRNPVLGERQTLRQIAVILLSYLVQHARPGTAVHISTESVEAATTLVIRFVTDDEELAVPEVAAHFISHLRGSFTLKRASRGYAALDVTLRGERPISVLVIDDNEGLISLFQRYLTDAHYRLLGAGDGLEGLRLAEEKLPDVIVLDVLMPGQDGWDILQHLREGNATRQIPVIVCSVLGDPQLAYSLGAAGFLPKPVSRRQLLDELARLDSQPGAS